MAGDIHRHDMFSFFDGSGSAKELAKIAKDKGYTCLGLTNHGNTSGLAAHYFACKEQGLKPILGVEAYFQPKFNKERKSFHLCLLAKNLQGYKNINKILTIANKINFYYNPIVTFELLERFSEGVICTSACIGGFISKALLKTNYDLALKAARKFKQIFGEDFYIEIMPYKIDSVGTQEEVNIKLIRLAEKLGIKCIFTSDSHYGLKEDFDSYSVIHQMKKVNLKKGITREKVAEEVKQAYAARYMPNLGDFEKRFIYLHGSYIAETWQLAQKIHNNNLVLEASVEDDILEGLEFGLPEFSEKNSRKLFQTKIIEGLKKRGKYNKKYLKRCKEEFEVITGHDFEDYFLIVQDYVRYAKKNNILVGPGRGSVCNSLVAYALGITEVDSIYFNLDFSRFLRKDKKKFPDIDLDFEVVRRPEVIEYIVKKYRGKAVRIGAYGNFKANSLVNELSKLFEVDEEDKKRFKKLVKSSMDGVNFSLELAEEHEEDFDILNTEYDNIVIHFEKLYGKVRNLTTHAAGVAVCHNNNKITDYVSIRRYKEDFIAAYDHFDIEKINAIKLDVLGLKALSEIEELEKLTGEKFSPEWFEDRKVLEQFSKGNTVGIFQFESNSARSILENINADCMEDIIAANALNRPGPLKLGMPEQYAYNKANIDEVRNSEYYEYTKETYGTIVYQEQIAAICRGLAKLDWDNVDKIMKLLKGDSYKKEGEGEVEELKELFVKGCMENGLDEEQALDIFSKILTYSFNKGHATGYAILALIDMYYKVYYPVQFWYVKLKYAPNEDILYTYKNQVSVDGNVIFLPHVNGTAQYSIKKIDGEYGLQEGLVNVKNCGLIAAQAIEEERKTNGDFEDVEDFIGRVPKRQVNKKVIDALLQNGALEFDEKKYLRKVVNYNSALYTKGIRK